MKEKEIGVTQIMDTKSLSETSKGHLVMRLHFLVSSYLNIYVQSKKTKEVVFGYSLGDRPRTIADKRSHLMTVDKVVAEMHVSDAFLETAEQI